MKLLSRSLARDNPVYRSLYGTASRISFFCHLSEMPTTRPCGASYRRLCTNPRVQSDTDSDTETPLKFDYVILFKMVEIGVGCRMAQCSRHCYDLALVMKGMGQDMVKDERRSADGDISIREIKFGLAVELPIRQS